MTFCFWNPTFATVGSSEKLPPTCRAPPKAPISAAVCLIYLPEPDSPIPRASVAAACLIYYQCKRSPVPLKEMKHLRWWTVVSQVGAFNVLNNARRLLCQPPFFLFLSLLSGRQASSACAGLCHTKNRHSAAFASLPVTTTSQRGTKNKRVHCFCKWLHVRQPDCWFHRGKRQHVRWHLLQSVAYLPHQWRLPCGLEATVTRLPWHLESSKRFWHVWSKGLLTETRTYTSLRTKDAKIQSQTRAHTQYRAEQKEDNDPHEGVYGNTLSD